MDTLAREKWEAWAGAHQDLLLSVERGPDLRQTRLIAEDLARKLELGPHDRLLDVGCGSGLVSSLLSEISGAEVWGCDFALNQLRLGRRHFRRIPFVQATAEAIPFADAQFTRILCYSVWLYVDDWRGALDGFLRVLRRPGIILVGDCPSQRHRWRLYVEYLKSMLRMLGSPKTLAAKFKYSHDTSHWHWVDLDETRRFVEQERPGCRAEILAQPKGHRQYGSVSQVYRFDLKIRAD